MDSKSKRPEGAEDRISQLQDDILVHILSYIPTVYSVRTMVLSKRWNNLWTFVPSLHFDQLDNRIGHYRTWYTFDDFAKFVDGALSLHNSSTIRKFRLHIGRIQLIREEGVSRIRDWICTAMRHEVCEFDLYFCPNYQLREKIELNLPQRVFLCKTLEVLKVHSNCINYPPTKPGYFPSLKFAKVTAEHGDNSSMGELFCNCPVLEELSIDAHLMKKDVKIWISAPELKTLRTRILVNDDERKVKGISINAPKLENLFVYTDLTRYILRNAKSLVKANIELTDFEENLSPELLNRATALLAGVSSVEYLHISGPNYVACSLPNFCNLKQLKLILFGCSYLEYVMELLKRSPKLEDLVLDIDVRSWYREEYVEGYEPFKPPEIVPICVVSHLKTVSITHITGHDDQLGVVKYLLKYGQVLRNMTIFTCGALLFKTSHITEEKFQRKILKYHKSSNTCEVEVKFENKGVVSKYCFPCGSSNLHLDQRYRR
ncbi:putative F-box domain, FBD domain, leucine-rich repeat domain, L domain-containing protein [Rosa chinensis]|uniref:Putative F-box domain, FBD domain, leucine-rich repeat domain, L domain-containing protein n=1 Tax=Rosa chinensis TaxID=74649 RepID=A0A2P6QX79_ROSCH|nr:putative F-box domain, FBD domain, leucine-rich repeat domain, L domain-containing protein [Rosa chinensis]